MDIKVVDLKSTGAGKLLAESFKETGFGIVTNHPISPDLINSVYSQWQGFFGSERKHDYTYDPSDQNGYFPFKSENAKDSSVKDLKEFFHNYYPFEKTPSGLGPETKELARSLTDLGFKLLSLLDANLPSGIKLSQPLGQMCQDSTSTLFRIIHYPPLGDSVEAGAIRAAAHEDINHITLLPSSTADGLEVKDAQGNWHQVGCDPGSVIVNVGDMLQECSNHYFISTTHRVVNPVGDKVQTSRYSMPLFLHPRGEVALSDRYTAQSYLDERLRELGLK